MRKTYAKILVISILLTVLYFFFEDRPPYLTLQEDIEDMLFYGAVYVALLFTTMSVIYNYIKKENNSGTRRRQ